MMQLCPHLPGSLTDLCKPNTRDCKMQTKGNGGYRKKQYFKRAYMVS